MKQTVTYRRHDKTVVPILACIQSCPTLEQGGCLSHYGPLDGMPENLESRPKIDFANPQPRKSQYAQNISLFVTKSALHNAISWWTKHNVSGTLTPEHKKYCSENFTKIAHTH